MNLYRLALPQRPPKSVQLVEDSEVITDQYVFKRLFSGKQSFLDNHIRIIRIIIYNDPLREIFYTFLKQEIELFDALCRYGKLKGWFDVPPYMNPQ